MILVKNSMYFFPIWEDKCALILHLLMNKIFKVQVFQLMYSFPVTYVKNERFPTCSNKVYFTCDSFAVCGKVQSTSQPALPLDTVCNWRCTVGVRWLVNF